MARAATRYPIVDDAAASAESLDYPGYQSDEIDLPPDLPDSEDDVF